MAERNGLGRGEVASETRVQQELEVQAGADGGRLRPGVYAVHEHALRFTVHGPRPGAHDSIKKARQPLLVSRRLACVGLGFSLEPRLRDGLLLAS